MEPGLLTSTGPPLDQSPIFPRRPSLPPRDRASSAPGVVPDRSSVRRLVGPAPDSAPTRNPRTTRGYRSDVLHPIADHRPWSSQRRFCSAAGRLRVPETTNLPDLGAWLHRAEPPYAREGSAPLLQDVPS